MRLARACGPVLLTLLAAVSAGSLGCAVAPEAGAATRAASAEDELTGRLEAKLATLKAAAGKMRGDDDELGAEGLLHRELVQIGPALTGEQQAAFTKAFWEQADHQKAMTDYFVAATAVSDELRGIIEDRQPDRLRVLLASSMKAAAGIENSAFEHRRDVFWDAAIELAKTPVPHVALRIGGLLLAADAFDDADPMKQFAKLRRDEVDGFDAKVREHLVSESFLGTALQLGVELGTAEATVSGLRAAVENIRRGYGTYNDIVNCGAMSPLLGALDAVVKDQSGGALAGVSPKALIGSEKTKNLDRAASAVGTFLALWDTGNTIAEGDLRGFLTTAPGAVSGVAQLTINIRRVTLGAARAETPFLQSVSKYAGRVASVVGVVTSTIALAKSIDENDGTMADKLHILGNAASVGAAIAALAGVPVAGPVLAAVAVGAHYIGKILEALQLEAEMKEDIAAALQSVQFPLSTAQIDIRAVLLASTPGRIAGLAASGLDGSQIQKLILMSPRLVEKRPADWDLDYTHLARMKEEIGMTGAEVLSMFETLQGKGGYSDASALRLFALARSFTQGDYKLHDPDWPRCERWRMWLRRERDQASAYFEVKADQDAWRTGMESVAAKLPKRCTPEPED